MKNALVLVTGWLNYITDVLKALIALGVAIGILFDDYFGVIGNIGEIMTKLGQEGLAGLVALVLIVSWYKTVK